MKTLARINALIMAIVLTLFSTGTVAFASEPQNQATIIEGNIANVAYNNDGLVETTYDFEITPDKVNENGITLLSTDVDQTFIMTSYHRGSNRAYEGCKLNVTMSATDTNGNAVNTILAARLYEHNTESKLIEIQCSANGQPVHLYDFNITSGKLYYFQYLVAYGMQQTLRVHMKIISHN